MSEAMYKSASDDGAAPEAATAEAAPAGDDDVVDAEFEVKEG